MLRIIIPRQTVFTGQYFNKLNNVGTSRMTKKLVQRRIRETYIVNEKERMME